VSLSMYDNSNTLPAALLCLAVCLCLSVCISV
jgi:hypothetical protein